VECKIEHKLKLHRCFFTKISFSAR